MKKFMYMTIILSSLIFMSACGSSDSNDDVNNNYSYLPVVDDKEAVSFLAQASFGATKDEIDSLKKKGFVTWIDNQMEIKHTESEVAQIISLSKSYDPISNPQTIDEYESNNTHIYNLSGTNLSKYYQMSIWFRNAILGKEQLRHRMAYALSQIIVISNADVLFIDRADGLAAYFDILTKHTFGNYKDILKEISHHPSMGIYLTYQGNKKADGKSTPDENYAREVMQLFTIGLYELNLDGTPKVDSKGEWIPTYTQTDIEELARVFTGWDMFGNSKYGRTNGDLHNPMEFNSQYHDDEEKTVLGETINAGLGDQDINRAIDILFEHENVAPFISTLLIKRITTSNPSPAYVKRVATIFNNNGSGVKGDLKAVFKAILLDEEARSIDVKHETAKMKEPLIAYTQLLRAFEMQGFDNYLSDSKIGNNTVSGIWFTDPSDYLGQAPARSSTVFNFYNPNYIPADSEFIQNNITTPETEIQTNQILIEFSNQIYYTLLNEKNIITQKYGSILQYVIDKETSLRYKGRDKFYLNFDEEFDLMEMIIDGDTNRDFENINDTTVDEDGNTLKKKAIIALLEHLNMKLTANTLTQEQKNLIIEYINSNINKNSSQKFLEASHCIQEAIRAITTSSTYMVQ